MKKCILLVVIAALLPLAGCVGPYPYDRYGYYDRGSAYGYYDYGSRYGYRDGYHHYSRRADPYAGYDGYY